MFLLVLLCISLLFDIATYIMEKESGYKVYYEVVRAIEGASGFFVLDGAFVFLVMAPAKAAEENIVLTEEELLAFPALVVCAFAIRVCIAFYLAYVHSQERVLREEAKAKLLPYTDEGGRVVLPGPDRKEAVGIRGDGTVRKITTEKKLKKYFSCDVPPEGLSLRGDDLRKKLI